MKSKKGHIGHLWGVTTIPETQEEWLEYVEQERLKVAREIMNGVKGVRCMLIEQGWPKGTNADFQSGMLASYKNVEETIAATYLGQEDRLGA